LLFWVFLPPLFLDQQCSFLDVFVIQIDVYFLLILLEFKLLLLMLLRPLVLDENGRLLDLLVFQVDVHHLLLALPDNLPFSPFALDKTSGLLD